MIRKPSAFIWIQFFSKVTLNIKTIFFVFIQLYIKKAKKYMKIVNTDNYDITFLHKDTYYDYIQLLKNICTHMGLIECLRCYW